MFSIIQTSFMSYPPLFRVVLSLTIVVQLVLFAYVWKTDGFWTSLGINTLYSLATGIPIQVWASKCHGKKSRNEVLDFVMRGKKQSKPRERR